MVPCAAESDIRAVRAGVDSPDVELGDIKGLLGSSFARISLLVPMSLCPGVAESGAVYQFELRSPRYPFWQWEQVAWIFNR